MTRKQRGGARRQQLAVAGSSASRCGGPNPHRYLCLPTPATIKQHRQWMTHQHGVGQLMQAAGGGGRAAPSSSWGGCCARMRRRHVRGTIAAPAAHPGAQIVVIGILIVCIEHVCVERHACCAVQRREAGARSKTCSARGVRGRSADAQRTAESCWGCLELPKASQGGRDRGRMDSAVHGLVARNGNRPQWAAVERVAIV
jgi:hypothetical protein